MSYCNKDIQSIVFLNDRSPTLIPTLYHVLQNIFTHKELETESPLHLVCKKFQKHFPVNLNLVS
jgi:hypothetical protein